MTSLAVVASCAALLIAGMPLSAPAQSARPQRPEPPVSSAGSAPFEPFNDACSKARRGEGHVRVAFYGASHTAADVLPNRLRERLQRRCGNGGPGWVIPAQPFAFYDHRRARFGGRGWQGRVARGRQPPMDDYGLAGIALDGEAGARATVRLDRPASFRVHLLRQPQGGRVRLGRRDEGQTVDTSGPPGVVIADARHAERLRLTVAEGPVRVFGIVAEHAHGAVVDNFGVPGARARNQLRWRERSLAPSLQGRRPDLWILAYGTNESVDRRVPIARYRQRLRQVIARWKERAPQASCLLVGPGDWPREGRDGTLRPRTRVGRIVEAQRAEAATAGCAFFDTLAWMGGPLAMKRWMAEGLALGDRVHFTDAGYERLGDALARLVLSGARRR